MSRKELYNHVWEKPVSHLAKENGLNYGRLLCTLKENDIPYPSSGYWTKVSLKKEVSFEKKPLPGDPDSAVTLALAGSVAERNTKKDATDDHSSPTAGISSCQTSNPACVILTPWMKHPKSAAIIGVFSTFAAGMISCISCCIKAFLCRKGQIKKTGFMRKRRAFYEHGQCRISFSKDSLDADPAASA